MRCQRDARLRSEGQSEDARAGVQRGPAGQYLLDQYNVLHTCRMPDIFIFFT